MIRTLAVFTSQLGTVSETFIRRHIEDLAPGRTVAVALHSSHPAGGRWAAPCPVLYLDRLDRSPLRRVARRAGVSAAAARQGAIRAFLRAHRVEVALAEYLDSSVEFAPLLAAMNIPYVVQGHGIDVSAALRRPQVAQQYLTFASARRVLTRCEFHRRRLIDLGLAADLVAVNPGGVDIPAKPPRRSEEASRHFLAIGRMVPKKGPIYLLEAFRRASHAAPDLTLDYVGGGGDMLTAARQFVQACGLSERVTLHGPASDQVKLGLIEKCGVMVQHSLTDPETGDEEGLPAAIQEAMANSMAVVSTRHSGIPEAVEEGVSGLLSDEADVETMARNMLAAASPDVARRLGAAGAARAARDYSWPAERARLTHHLGLSAQGNNA